MLQDRIFFFIWDLLFRNLDFQSKVDPTPCLNNLKQNTIQITFLETNEVDRQPCKFFLQKNIRNYLLRLYYIRKPSYHKIS